VVIRSTFLQINTTLEDDFEGFLEYLADMEKTAIKVEVKFKQKSAPQKLKHNDGEKTPITPALEIRTDEIQWKRGELIGSGGFGKVYLGLDLDKGTMMAVKQIPLPDGASKSDRRVEREIQLIESEIDLMSRLNHDNIVRYLGTQRSPKHLHIFLEYMPGGSLSSMLKKFGIMNETVIRKFLKQILAGLAYLHGNNIVHRDIKGANVLVDDRGNVKLADFGASKMVELKNTVTNDDKHSVKGTPGMKFVRQF
jgi:serine/threonine protein kinase